MRKMIGAAMLLLTVACGGESVVGPSPETRVPEPASQVAQPPVTPAPVVPTPAPAGPEHDARVKGGFYSITNTTGIRQFYCAAAFGVLPGGEQGAGTNLYEDQGVREPKDVFSGQAPKTASCQYKQIQVDLTQSKDCRNFDWHNVLAAEVYANPAFIDGAKKTKLEALAYGDWSEYGPWSGEACGTRTRTRKVYEQYKYDCSGEVVKVEVRTETDTETKECQKTCADFQAPTITFTGGPQIDNSGENRGFDGPGNTAPSGGTWSHSFPYETDDPGTKLSVTYTVVKTYGPQDLECSVRDSKTFEYTYPVPECDDVRFWDQSINENKNVVKANVHVSGDGNWVLVLYATSKQSEYDNNDPDYTKDTDNKNIGCKGQGELKVEYNWSGHGSTYWWAALYRDNVRVWKSDPIVKN